MHCSPSNVHAGVRPVELHKNFVGKIPALGRWTTKNASGLEQYRKAVEFAAAGKL